MFCHGQNAVLGRKTMRTSWPVWLSLVGTLFLPSQVRAQGGAAPIDIGTLGGQWIQEVRDINRRGQVVGASYLAFGSPHAFSWTAEQGLLDLGAPCGADSMATFVTDAGVVFGYNTCPASATFGSEYAFRAFYWTPFVGMVPLAPTYGEETVVHAVDPVTGQAVGYSCRRDSFDDCRAFSWTATGGMVDMSPATNCWASDVNARGQATGFCGNQSFIWSQAGGMTFLEPATPGALCYAEAISDPGQVVGNCVNGFERFAFSWTAAGGMVEIRLEGTSNTYARLVNNAGQVGGDSGIGAWAWTQQGGTVLIRPANGWSTNLLGLTQSGHFVGYTTQLFPSTGVQHAFAWTAQQGLTPLVFANGGNSFPRDWSSNGQVVGFAIRADGAYRGFSWTPSGGMVELQPLSGLQPSTEMSDAVAVNERGQVAGWSSYVDPLTSQSRQPATLWNTTRLSRFFDVPGNHWAFDFVEALAESGISGGCGNGNFCPETPVTRAQMAVFLERGMRGSAYAPPPASGTLFSDVAANSFAAPFIEQLFRDGISGGCGGGNYCPQRSVTRAQMAVFLLRARYGGNYLPPAPRGVFSDVGTGYWAAAWIEQLAAEGITGGCGDGRYCPENPVTRAQMSVFLVRTFGL